MSAEMEERDWNLNIPCNSQFHYCASKPCSAVPDNKAYISKQKYVPIVRGKKKAK